MALTNCTLESVSYHPSLLGILITFFTIIGLLMLAGYLWVVVAVVRTHTLHTASNCFLASLAVAEICIGVLGQPCVIVFTNTQCFNETSVFFLSWAMLFCLMGYFLNAVLMSADRWFKISRPFVYVRAMSWSKCVVCLASIWALSVVGSICGAVAHVLLSDISAGNRNAVMNSFSTVSVVYCYVIILPCVVVITVFNILIVRIARRQARAIAADLPRPPNPGDAGHIEADHRKSTRQFSIFLSSFVLAWFPMAILTHLVNLTAAVSDTAVNVAFLIYSAIVLAQAAFGTFILTIVQPEYRQILKRNLRELGKKLHCIT